MICIIQKSSIINFAFKCPVDDERRERLRYVHFTRPSSVVERYWDLQNRFARSTNDVTEHAEIMTHRRA